MTEHVTLHDCKHCGGSGTCKTNDGKSCDACLNEVIRKSWLMSKFTKNKQVANETGLVCSVCDGLGKAQTKTNKINSRARFMLALWITLPLLFLMVLLKGDNNFPQFLTFASTLISGITGFYFATKDD